MILLLGAALFFVVLGVLKRHGDHFLRLQANLAAEEKAAAKVERKRAKRKKGAKAAPELDATEAAPDTSAELIAALRSLGYRKERAATMAQNAAHRVGAGASFEDLFNAAFKKDATKPDA